jgi:hypothetical protein
MRCIFCKKDGTTSVSKEHIIPESLGNTLHTLPLGVVCDTCNDYFAREVEKPFLESEPVRSLRFEQAIINIKRENSNIDWGDNARVSFSGCDAVRLRANSRACY